MFPKKGISETWFQFPVELFLPLFPFFLLSSIDTFFRAVFGSQEIEDTGVPHIHPHPTQAQPASPSTSPPCVHLLQLMNLH